MIAKRLITNIVTKQQIATSWQHRITMSHNKPYTKLYLHWLVWWLSVYAHSYELWWVGNWGRNIYIYITQGQSKPCEKAFGYWILIRLRILLHPQMIVPLLNFWCPGEQQLVAAREILVPWMSSCDLVHVWILTIVLHQTCDESAADLLIQVNHSIHKT